MSVEDEYNDLVKRSWVEPLEQVNHVIAKERKKQVVTHTRENHEYHMQKYKRCVYCDNHIPLQEGV